MEIFWPRFIDQHWSIKFKCRCHCYIAAEAIVIANGIAASFELTESSLSTAIYPTHAPVDDELSTRTIPTTAAIPIPITITIPISIPISIRSTASATYSNFNLSPKSTASSSYIKHASFKSEHKPNPTAASNPTAANQSCNALP